jgi:hypothetical protein
MRGSGANAEKRSREVVQIVDDLFEQAREHLALTGTHDDGVHGITPADTEESVPTETAAEPEVTEDVTPEEIAPTRAQLRAQRRQEKAEAREAARLEREAAKRAAVVEPEVTEDVTPEEIVPTRAQLRAQRRQEKTAAREAARLEREANKDRTAPGSDSVLGEVHDTGQPLPDLEYYRGEAPGPDAEVIPDSENSGEPSLRELRREERTRTRELKAAQKQADKERAQQESKALRDAQIEEKASHGGSRRLEAERARMVKKARKQRIAELKAAQATENAQKKKAGVTRPVSPIPEEGRDFGVYLMPELELNGVEAFTLPSDATVIMDDDPTQGRLSATYRRARKLGLLESADDGEPTPTPTPVSSVEDGPEFDWELAGLAEPLPERLGGPE